MEQVTHVPGSQYVGPPCYGDVGGADRALVGARFARQEVVDARVAKEVLALAVQLRGVHVQVLMSCGSRVQGTGVAAATTAQNILEQTAGQQSLATIFFGKSQSALALRSNTAASGRSIFTT